MSLGTVAARGATITVFLQFLRFIIQLGGLVLLGRLLAPGDFGLLVMLTAIIGFGDVLRDFGLMSAAVQAKQLSRGQQTNLFWINSLIGLFLAALCAFISPLIADFYGDSRLLYVGIVLAGTFILSGLQTQYQALLTRSMRFTALSTTELLSQVIALLTATGGALGGWGYWALVAQLVVQPACLLFFRALISRWVPGLPSRGNKMLPLLRYGMNLMLTQSLVYLSSNVDSIVIGARFGASAAGFYNRAFQVLMMPLNQIFAPITAVALPVLSKLQDDVVRYGRFLQRAQILIAYPSVVLFAVVAGPARSLMELVFGYQWVPSAPIFQILAFGGAFQAVSYIGYWVFLSKGLTGSHFRYSLISRSVVIASVLLGSTGGPLGIALGYSLSISVMWPVSLFWLHRAAKIAVTPLLLGGIRIIFVGSLGAFSGLVAAYYYRESEPIVAVAVAVPLAVAVIGISLFLIPACRRDLADCLATSKLLIRRKQNENMSPLGART